MRAVICHNAELSVEEIAEPTPDRGQVRIEVTRCGICGSDLHARHGIDEWAALTDRLGYTRFGRSSERLVFGHEYTGTVAEYGPKTRKQLKTGTPVVALPLIRNGDHVDSVGLSVHAPGGYAEQMLVQEAMMLPVPNGLPPDKAAFTEPMAVAYHAVRRGEVGKGQPAIVIGCGPIGLAVILALKAQGVRTVIASDYSAGRRDLARKCGADVVVDPGTTSPYEVKEATPKGVNTTAPEIFELAMGTTEQLHRIPKLGPWPIFRLADRLGVGPKFPVVFECVGVPGVIDSILLNAPVWSRVVVVGVCVGGDQITPAMAINKEIDLRFVLGYTPLEFRDTLHLLADGKLDPTPLITGTVGLDGVDAAFTALGDPEAHAKIMVDPRSAATEPVAQ